MTVYPPTPLRWAPVSMRAVAREFGWNIEIAGNPLIMIS
jgi:hypothetical protein